MRNDLGSDSSNATLESPPVSVRGVNGDRKRKVEKECRDRRGREKSAWVKDVK